MGRHALAAGLSVLSVSLVCARAVSSGRSPICFGGVPEPAIAGATGASDLSIAGGHLYWSNAGTRGLWRGDPGMSGGTSLNRRFGDDLQVCAIDGDEIFAVGDDDEIVAFNQRDGTFRVLLAAAPPANGSMLGLLDCRVKVDARYLYFSRTRTLPEAGHENGFFRLRRDGSGQPERLGPPIPGDSPVALGGGYVYFRARLPDGGLALVRRSLEPSAPVQTVTPLPAPDPPSRFPVPGLLRVADGVIYYSDQASNGAIWSVLADGSTKPVRRVSVGDVGAVDMLVEGGCLYWATETQIWRQALEAPGRVRPELVADRRTYHEDLHGSHARLATDGHHLYWTDLERNRIMRAARDRRPLPLRVANSPGAGSPAEVAAWAVTVGDGWGCVGYEPEPIVRWQCWSAGAVGAAPALIEAHRVPWLDGLSLRAGPDRLCAAVSGGEPPCWRWPEIARHQPPKLPDARSNRGSGDLLAVGGTFACTMYSNVWSCVGDDRFGQLSGVTGDLIHTASRSGGLGLWHACERVGDDVTCWGRGDGGQLGFAPAESCRDGSQSIPCSRSPRSVPFTLPAGAELMAGDMFSCAFADRHIQCWGASRDGLFGTRAACPVALSTRWPTPSGPVAAPNSTCSPVPANLPGLPAAVNQVNVGPRGACSFTGDRHHHEAHCAGAIATPTLDVRNIAVEPGERASACGIAGRDVACWGDGYSPPDRPNLPIRITFDRSPLPRTSALDASPPGDAPWPPPCGIHYGCQEAARTLPVCGQGAAPRSWIDLQPKAATLVDQRVRVHGPLAVSAFDPQVWSLRPGDQAVCGQTDPVPVIIGGAYQELSLEGFQCLGDQSRHCCNVAPLGQNVVAEGVLKRGYTTPWSLAGVTLCTPASRP